MYVMHLKLVVHKLKQLIKLLKNLHIKYPIVMSSGSLIELHILINLPPLKQNILDQTKCKISLYLVICVSIIYIHTLQEAPFLEPNFYLCKHQHQMYRTIMNLLVKAKKKKMILINFINNRILPMIKST